MARLSLILLTVLLAGCGQPKEQLHVLIWTEYIDPKIVVAFEKQFHCKVTLDYYDDNEAMMTKLATGGSSVYDLVVPSHVSIPSLARRGLLAPLRHENIPNLKNLDAPFVNPSFDPGNQFSAPYQWAALGIFVRMPKDQPIDETWGLIFDPAKRPGPFLLSDGARASLGAALRYKGHSVNSASPSELTEARDLLIEAKKRSLGFADPLGSKNRVLAREARMAMVASGDAMSGLSEDPDTYFFLPREGSMIFIDNMCVPSGAPNRDLAEKFIDFILDPKVGAQLSNFNRFATPNKAALPFIDPKDRNNPAVYPPPEAMGRLEFPTDLGDKQKLYDELWTQIKSK